ncbi:hypothetical protein BGZ63DRAFT_426265 [Mariannaea sp. PMI_226]|nr:hypothetical protein BGZ63DRAFT_426265 [Mariannaea sp. PMI_226]
MEAIGAGANVLAFVVLGLKSAKVVYETFSAIKDGPEIVQQLAKDCRQLHSLLTWVRQSQVAASDPALLQQAQQGAQELQELANSIQNLRLSPADRFSGQCWKRLKVLVKEKDLIRIDNRLLQIALLLSTRISVLSSDLTFEVKAVSEELIQRAQSLDTSIQQQFNLQTTRLVELDDSISSALGDQGTIQQGFESLEKTIQAGTAINTENISSIQAMLQEIRESILASSSNAVPIAEASDGSDQDSLHRQAELNENSLVSQQLLASLDRLDGLVDERRTCINAYEEEDALAESVMDDLQQLLRSIKEYKSPVDRTENLHPSVRMNIPREPGMKVRQIRTFDQKDVGIGKLNLVISKRNRSSAEETDDDRGHNKRQRTDYSMTLTFLPKKPQDRHMVVASLLQRQSPFGGVVSISNLMVNRVRPEGSPVFELVRNGDLGGLQQMFEQNLASPRDHDEHGASLLMYSMGQPEMCKFLISCGLDVDHVGYSTAISKIARRGDPKCALQIDVYHMDGTTGDHRRRTNQCRRLLLEAGADPTLDLTTDGVGHFLERASSDLNDPEAIRIAWNPDLTGHIADINKTKFGSDSRSPFIYILAEITGDDLLRRNFLDTLISMGADIRARTDKGESCLHICFICISYFHDTSDVITLKWLVERGADPFAVDNGGVSVSDLAYSMGAEMGEDWGSYYGDLWDVVLHSCGYTISEFRSRQYRREANYSRWYSRNDFESLWSGRETECPYWDDNPWPPFQSGEMESDDIKWKTFVANIDKEINQKNDTGGLEVWASHRRRIGESVDISQHRLNETNQGTNQSQTIVSDSFDWIGERNTEVQEIDNEQRMSPDTWQYERMHLENPWID